MPLRRKDLILLATRLESAGKRSDTYALHKRLADK